MKSLKLLAMGTMAAAAVSLASASTFIKITGSTAFRKATMAAIIDSLNSPTGAYDVSAKGIAGSNRMIVHGTLKSTGADVYFQTAWAGSVGGVHTLVSNLTIPPNSGWTDSTTWLSSINSMSTVSTDGSHNPLGGTDVSASAVFETTPATADISMSDSFQSSTNYSTPVLTDTIVGVVGFTWAKGLTVNTGTNSIPAASQAALTNISPQQAQALLTNGAVPLSFFTGNSADDAYDVVLTGRDNDSGTRLTTFAESGFGVNNSPVQYSVNTTTGVLTAFPSTGGYSSGGNVKATLQATIPAGTNSPNSLPYILVSYLGISDTPGSAQQLTYNGVPYSVAAIQEGQYTFWSYEHMLYRSTLSDAVKLQSATDVVAQIAGGDALASGLKYDGGSGTTAGTLRVTRYVDGGLVISNLR